VRYYDSLDSLPIHNWWKVEETGDLGYILLNKPSIEIFKEDELVKVLEKLNNEFINNHSKDNDDFKLLVSLKEDYVIARVNAITEKDLDQEMKADLLDLRIIGMESGNDSDLSKADLIHIIETSKGYEIDTKTMSVNKFHDILNSIMKEHGKAKNK